MTEPSYVNGVEVINSGGLTLYVANQGVMMKVRFGGRPYPPEARSDPEPVAENCHRPSLITPWGIEGIKPACSSARDRSRSLESQNRQSICSNHSMVEN
jgi:hypothetical protein